MVYKSVDHGKLKSNLFFTITFIFTKNKKTKQPALRDMLRHFHGLYSHRPWLSTNQRARIRSVIVKLYLVLASIHALCHDLSQRRLEILPLPALFPSAPRLILRHALLSKLQSSVKYAIFFYYLKDSVVTWS